MKHSTKIQKLLDDKGWSMLELSRRAQVGREQTRRLGVRIPSSLAAALRIAKTLGVSSDWLFDDDQPWMEGGLPPGQTSHAKHEAVDIDLLRRELRKLLDL